MSVCVFVCGVCACMNGASLIPRPEEEVEGLGTRLEWCYIFAWLTVDVYT